MKRGIQFLYYLTTVTSCAVGLWHFFVPWMFRWYDYLPTQYENLIVGIDYTNYCFSLLLFGLSLLLAVLGKRALAGSGDVRVFYLFLTVVWVFRAMLSTFLEPWPPDPIPAAAIGQLVASDLLAILMVIVAAALYGKRSVSTARMWSVSLMVIGAATVILMGAEILGVELPDPMARMLGAADLLALPVLVYTTVKKRR